VARDCPLCAAPAVPIYRVVCARCFKRYPGREELMAAYRRRVIEPGRYQEEMAGARTWFREFVLIGRECGGSRSELQAPGT